MQMHPKAKSELVEATGPWRFITRRVYRRQGGEQWVWRSRHHRKRLGQTVTATQVLREVGVRQILWQPNKLNWWIGVTFALGASLFVLGSILCLAPGLAARWDLSSLGINAIFFTGSVPFTTAAYMQLFQSANAGDGPPDDREERKRVALLGWRPHDVGWLSCALQFVGTILFNFNTFDAMIPGMDWLQEDLTVWLPDVLGSVLFLASGYLAYTETCHASWGWKPSSLSWWITFVNLLGCIAFMVSALFAFVPPKTPDFDAAGISLGFTLLGALGFLVGALLMLPETATEDSHT